MRDPDQTCPLAEGVKRSQSRSATTKPPAYSASPRPILSAASNYTIFATSCGKKGLLLEPVDIGISNWNDNP